MAIKRDTTDHYFSKAIRMRNDWTCEKCFKCDDNAKMTNKSKFIETAHVYTRRYRHTRWHSDNAIAACNACHRWFGDNPPDFYIFIKNNILGETRMDLLMKRKSVSRKYTKAEKAEITEHWKSECKRLEKLRMNGTQGYIDLIDYD